MSISYPFNFFQAEEGIRDTSVTGVQTCALPILVWRTWSTQPMQSVCFVDPQNGWGANGKQVFRTSDAGVTWRRVFDAPIDEQRYGHFSAEIACSDLLTGWVQLRNGGAALSHSGYLVF